MNDDVDASETEFIHENVSNNIPKEVIDLVFVDGLSKEDKILSEFISHTDEDAVGKLLVSRPQDRRCSSTRFEQLVPE